MGENRTNVDQYQLRLPAGMREEIAAAAKSNGRSMNSEIIARVSSAETASDLAALREKFAIMEWEAIKNQRTPVPIGAIAEMIGIDESEYKASVHWPMYVAKRSYAMADAMIAARKAGA